MSINVKPKALVLFTEEETVTLMEMVLAKTFIPSKLLDGEGKPYIDLAFRSSETVTVRADEALYVAIMDRIVEKLPQINAQFNFDLHTDPAQLVPEFTVNRYSALRKGRIGMHIDAGILPKKDDRKLSLSILLTGTNRYKGGSLVILDGNVHRPLDGAPAGTVAIFPGFTLHEVEEVTDGARYSAVVWLHGPTFR